MREHVAVNRRFAKVKVARLDFLGLYLPTLSINYVGISKDMEKKVTTTVLYKDENFL